MTLSVKQTPPVHPPRRRTVEGSVDGYEVRATALSHYNPDTNTYGPFEITDSFQISKAGYVRLSAQQGELATILELVADASAKLTEPEAAA